MNKTKFALSFNTLRTSSFIVTSQLLSISKIALWTVTWQFKDYRERVKYSLSNKLKINYTYHLIIKYLWGQLIIQTNHLCHYSKINNLISLD